MMSKGKIPSEVTLVLGSRKQRIPVNYLCLLILLLLLAVGSLARGLTGGNGWWSDTPRIANMQRMSALQKSGIPVPGTTTVDRRELQLGEGKWSAQIVERPDETRITVLLKPQVYYKDQPEVEWSDIRSIGRWQTDRPIELTFPSPSGGTVTARFYRAWQTNTFAIVQWYAWLGGGHHDPAVWYWSDQTARLQKQRVPWIAVSLHIPLDPAKKLDTARAIALDLATKVQGQLEANVLSKVSADSPGR